MIKTESFRLFAALAIVIGGAAALFFTFHSLAADSNIQSEQAGIVLQAPQSGADGAMSDAAQLAQSAGTASLLVPSNGSSSDSSSTTTPGTQNGGRTTTPGSVPGTQPGQTTVPVMPAPPIDLDDPDDLDDDLDDDRHDNDPDDNEARDKD